MTWTLVQKTASVTSSSTGTVTGTLPAGSTAGNLLVAFLASQTGGTQFTGPAGWTQGPQAGNGSVSRSEIWYYLGNPGGISSAAFTSGTGNVRCVLAEFHTDVASAVVSLDFSGTGTAGAVASVTVTASAAAGDLAVFACMEHFNSNQNITWTDPAGFTLAAAQSNANTTSNSYSAYDLSAAAGSLSVTGTSSLATANANGWTGAAATFTATAGASQTVLVGASVQTTAFPSGTTGPQAAAAFASATGRAIQVQRVYIQNAGTVGTNGSVSLAQGTPDTIQQCLNAGRYVVMSFKPAFNPPTQSDYNALQTTLAAFQAAGVQGEVALWHEPETTSKNITPSQYGTMTQFYAPAVKPYFPLVSILDYGSGTVQQFTSYFNSVPAGTFAKGYIDFYCRGWVNGLTLDGAAAAVDAQGIPFGVGEYGCSLANDGLQACLDYFTYMTSFFSARKTAGTPVAPIIWFNNGNSGTLTQAITSSSDPRVPAYQNLFDTLASSGAGTVTIGASLQVVATAAGTVTGGTPQPQAPANPGAAGPPGFPVLIGEIGVVPTAPVPAPGTFLLGDPAYGLLNLDVLGGTTSWADISTFVKSFTVTRTSTRQNAPVITYDPGTMSATLDNTDGRFDPDNLTGPYVAAGVTQIHPMTPARLRAAWEGTIYPLFSGYADSWITPDTNYGPHTQEMGLSATDGFKVLQGFQLAGAAAQLSGQHELPLGPGDDTGARIASLLDIAGWDNDARDIDTGNTQLQGTSLASSDALTEMQLSADTELGELYMSSAGKVTFRRRHGVMEDTRSNTAQAIFSDNPAAGALPYSGLGRSNDDAQLCNDCQVTAAGSSNLQEATDAASVARFLYQRSYSRTDLLLESDTEALEWAQFIVYLSKGAEDRFDTVTLSPLRDPRLWPHALGREIGDMITVTRTPPNTAAITKNLIIRGITHTVSVSPASWQTQWILQDASRYSFLTLDGTALGKLDSNALAY